MRKREVKMAEKIYSEIPMRTWRWLGVNEAKADEAVLAIDNGRQELLVPAGESRQLTVVYRQAGEGQVQVKVEKGGFLKLTTVQLLPVDAQGASSVQVELADTAELEAVAVEAGSAKSLAKMEVNLAGNESKANVYVLYFGHGARQLDMNYVLVQQGKIQRLIFMFMVLCWEMPTKFSVVLWISVMVPKAPRDMKRKKWWCFPPRCGIAVCL